MGTDGWMVLDLFALKMDGNGRMDGFGSFRSKKGMVTDAAMQERERYRQCRILWDEKTIFEGNGPVFSDTRSLSVDRTSGNRMIFFWGGVLA